MNLSKFSAQKFFLVTSFFLGLLSFNSGLLYYNFSAINEHESWVRNSSDIVNEINLMLSGVKDAESGARGYLLTRQEEYLVPYHSGIAEAKKNAEKIKFLVSDNPEQYLLILEIDKLLNKRFSVLAELIESYKNQSKPVEAFDSRFSQGKDLMDGLRGLVEQIKNNEKKLLIDRDKKTQNSRENFLLTLVFTTIVTLALILISSYRLAANQKLIDSELEKNELEVRQKDALASLTKLISGDLSLGQVSSHLMDYFSKNFQVLAGRVFVYDKRQLKCFASYGLKEVNRHNSDEFIKGLVETALKRRQLWEVTDVPNEYWHINSSLGEAKPNQILFLPFSFQDEVIGILELATFKSLDEIQKNVLASISEAIGVSVNAARSRDDMHDLLEKTQQQSEELQAQQEELKTSNEELEQQARAFELQQQSLTIKNKELELIQSRLSSKASELEKTSRYKSDFLAKMSHELRTPLNGLMILSSLLVENKEKNLTEKQIDFAKSIKSAGQDLLLLINDILDLSKIEAKKLSLRIEKFTIGDLVRSKQKTFDPQFHEKNLAFIIPVSDEIKKIELTTDRHRLDQILRNFISNAIKFTESGSVTLDAKISNSKVIFSVADTGIGIPIDKQEVIFEAFEQADTSVSRRFGGTGLGLTISKELAQLLGGSIRLTSQEGKGSVFSLELPLVLNQTTAAIVTTPMPLIHHESNRLETLTSGNESAANAISVINKINKDKKTILVVEDDEKFRRSVCEVIETYGFEPVECGDGETALDILKDFIPSAILLDIKLPGLSGLGVLEIIKQMPKMRHVPVHMISGLEYQNRALRMGALGYLTKPVTLEKIKAAVERLENTISKKISNVLLVEDDKVQSDAISELISGSDIEVHVAKSGDEAKKLLSASGFDCIIMDINLPDITGFELLSELKSLPISLPPVVIYTGKDLTSEEESYLRRFSESIIIKGAKSPERLLDEVNLFLHRVESLLPADKQEILSTMRSQGSLFKDKKILIADDDIRNIFALTSALEEKNFEIIVARDGQEALDALDKNEDIDLVLMDIMMPRMDGIEAMKHIRANEIQRIKDIPIIALTAKAMKEDHEICIQAGANDYLQKPVNLDNLMTVLKVWLSSKGSES